MDKLLQARVWQVLPKEFKEEVQFQYQNGSLEEREKFRDLFGSDNLISDITTEEILVINRKQIQKMDAAAFHNIQLNIANNTDDTFWRGYRYALASIFDSQRFVGE